MSESSYKRLEQIIVIIMLLGIVAMFQPWFKGIVELFEPLAPDARLGRTYKNEIAPVIFRYGFFATFLGTVAFIVISHYSYDDFVTAFATKGKLLTLALVALPVVYGFIVIGHLSEANNWPAILNVINVICAIALWNMKRWGLIGLAVTALIEFVLALNGTAPMPVAVFILVMVIITAALTWPRRMALT